MLDIRKLEYDKAVQHLTTAITYHKDNAVAIALMIYASYLQGDKKASERQYLSVEAINAGAKFGSRSRASL